MNTLPVVGEAVKIRGRFVKVTAVEPDPIHPGQHVVTGVNRAGNTVTAVF